MTFTIWVDNPDEPTEITMVPGLSTPDGDCVLFCQLEADSVEEANRRYHAWMNNDMRGEP